MAQQPATVDLRAGLGPIRWQGQRPTCLVFAASAAHEHARQNTEPLSPEALFRGCVRRDPLAPALGTTLSVALTTIEDDGQCTETAWPYGAIDAAETAPTYYHARDDARDDVDLVAFVRARLAADRSVLLTLRLTDAWHRVGHDGVVAAPSPADTTLGGHAVLAVGYDAPKERILIRNSWGLRWGDGGHAWLPDAYVERYGYEGVAIVALHTSAVRPIAVP